ncbi:MAG: glycosyltransferase family 4 protein [Planctomycetes bacterium]|nr:glycosyltransferase family 4 protein [Planctomycetota bacterium]
MAAAWRAQGHDVTILNMAQRKLDDVLDNGAVVRQRRYRLRPIPVKWAKALDFSWQLGVIHRRKAIDCVLAMGLESGAAAHRFRKRTGVPFVLNPRSGMKYKPGNWKHDRALMLTRECDGFIGLSQSAMQDWLNTTGLPDDGRFHGIHNGIDHSVHEGGIEPVPGVPDTRPLILCMGGLRKVKGQIQVLDALKQIEDLQWHALFAGDGKHARRIRDHCSKLGLDGRTTWPGTITGAKWRWAFRESALYCLTPIYPEAFGNTFLEAQLAGLPVVTSNFGALPEFVLDGKTGFIAPEAEMVEHTASALRKLLTDEALRERMGAAAREHAGTYSWDKSAREYADVMEKCKTARA